MSITSSVINSLKIGQAAGGGGGAPAFDIDTLYGASTVGDFFAATVNSYEDDGSTDPADTAGDLVWRHTGGRSAGSAVSIANSTASARPEIASDGTYGLVMKLTASAVKELFSSGYAWSSSGSGMTFGVRIRRPTHTNASTNNGFGIGQHHTSWVDAIGEVNDGTSMKWAIGQSSTNSARSADTSTDWLTIVGTYDSSRSATLYINDSSTPVATNSGSGDIGTASFIRFGKSSSDGNDAYIHKWFYINDSGVDVANVMSWLEA